MKKKLNIAIFHLAFFYSGGGEKLVLREMEELKKRGHNVICFAPTIDKRLCFPDIINDFNIKTFFPAFPKFIPHKESLEILFACLFFPLIAKRFNKFDVILGANQPGPWFAWIVKKMTGKPYVIYLAQPTRILYPRKIDKTEGLWIKQRAYFFPLLVRLSRPFIKWADKVSIKRAEKMLVNGNYIGTILKKTYNRDYLYCPAGADIGRNGILNRFSGIVNASGINIKKPYILLTNRHFPQKKFQYAIEAMVQIVKELPDIKLVITGNFTGYTVLLQRLARKKQLEKNIFFTGFVSEKNLAVFYRNAALYVYTSPQEDFGMGVIEAMSAGIPVVAWRKGGPQNTIINEKTGYLVEPYSQKKFTQKILYLLKNKKINTIMGKNGTVHVKKNYGYKKHIDLLEKTLKEAAAL